MGSGAAGVPRNSGSLPARASRPPPRSTRPDLAQHDDGVGEKPEHPRHDSRRRGAVGERQGDGSCLDHFQPSSGDGLAVLLTGDADHLRAVVDGESAAAALERLVKQRAAATADLEQHVVAPQVEHPEQHFEARAVVERVAVDLSSGRARRPARPAIGEPVAQTLAEERRHELTGEPAGQLATVAEKRLEAVMLDGHQRPVACGHEAKLHPGHRLLPGSRAPLEADLPARLCRLDRDARGGELLEDRPERFRRVERQLDLRADDQAAAALSASSSQSMFAAASAVGCPGPS